MIQKNTFVKTNISITKDQHAFLKTSPYNLSALVRITIDDVMNREKENE
jgi:hypothetical protein